MSITKYAAGLTFTASASLLASCGSDPKDSANLAHTFDQLLKNNPQLLEENRHLMGEMCRLLITLRAISLGNDPLNSTPVNQIQTPDHLAGKNRRLPKKNQKLVGEVAAARNKLAEPSEARAKVKAKKHRENCSGDCLTRSEGLEMIRPRILALPLRWVVERWELELHRPAIFRWSRGGD